MNNRRRTPSIIAASIAALALTVALGACNQTAGLTPTTEAAPGRSEAQAAVTQYGDIPIPNGFTMDMAATRTYGGSGAWFGQLALNTPHQANDMFDFYKTEMPGFGWREITAIRAAQSILSYSNQGRVATIQITSRGLGGSAITFSVSPEGTGAQPAAR